MVSERACGSHICLLLDSFFICYFHATPIRGPFVLFRLLVCRRTTKPNFFCSIEVHGASDMCWLFTVCIGIGVDFISWTHTHAWQWQPHTHRSTRSFYWIYTLFKLLNMCYDTTLMPVLSNTEREFLLLFLVNAGREFLYWLSKINYYAFVPYKWNEIHIGNATFILIWIAYCKSYALW